MIEIPSNKAIEKILTVKVQKYNKFLQEWTSEPYECFVRSPDGSRIIFDRGFLDNPEVLKVIARQKNFTPDKLEVPVIDITGFKIQPRDYQLYAAKYALTKKRCALLMATGSGKSLTITIMLEYFRSKGLKGILIVPNINLLNQFKNDIYSYLKIEDYCQIVGGGKKFNGFSKHLIISTWQSINSNDEMLFSLKDIDFIICDEMHRFASEKTVDIIRFFKTKYRIGLTGTIPDKEPQKSVLFGLFGKPKEIIDSRELIERGQGSKIHVTNVLLEYNNFTNSRIKTLKGDYLRTLKYLISLNDRQDFIAKLALRLQQTEKGGVLVLYTLTDHGLDIFKRVGGTDHLNFRNNKNVMFMNGAIKAKDREEMRQFMDTSPNGLLVANYALLSTGVNIRNLRYMILASPMRSTVTITQSLGRGIRVYEGKDKFDVFDIVDVFNTIRTFENSNRDRNQKIYTKTCSEIKAFRKKIGPDDTLVSYSI